MWNNYKLKKIFNIIYRYLNFIIKIIFIFIKLLIKKYRNKNIINLDLNKNYKIDNIIYINFFFK